MRYLILITLLYGCASNKYEVVQQLSHDQWHTQNIKNKDVIIYRTDLKLNVGDIVKIPNKAK